MLKRIILKIISPHDGYYHPALKPVVSVTAVINGKKKTSTTFIDKDGNTFFQNREE